MKPDYQPLRRKQRPIPVSSGHAPKDTRVPEWEGMVSGKWVRIFSEVAYRQHLLDIAEVERQLQEGKL